MGWGNDEMTCGIVADERQSEEVIEVMVRQRHEVLILAVDRGVEGRWRGRQPAANVSMISMRLPQ
jgi:hypothetical protein